MSYAVHLLIVCSVFGLLSLSLNLSCGLLGLVPLWQAGLFGLGAYGTGLLLSNMAVDGSVALLICTGFGLAAGVVAGYSLLKLRGDYFALASFALQLILSATYVNARSITGGPVGMGGYGSLRMCGGEVGPGMSIVLLVAANVALALVAWRTLRSPAGRMLAAMRQDDNFAVVAGANPNHYRLWASGLGGAAAAFAGALYANYLTFVNPSLFSVDESIGVVACVVLGGAGSPIGPVAGTLVFVLIPETLRFAGIPTAQAANLRQILFGVGLVLLMRFRPEGLLGGTRVGYGGQSDA